MNERVQRLREQSIKAIPRISAECALLMTEFYAGAEFFSAPMKRALAFKHLMGKKVICINEDELIVGERGPAPKATCTHPELCCHSLEDLDILNTREKIWFRVDEETKRAYREQIIPFWRGRSLREKIFEEMSPEWKAAYESGIFTEFMEQRAPGHTVLDGKIYKKGMLDFKWEISTSLDRLDFLNDPEAYRKKEELRAMSIAIDAIIALAGRYADKAYELAMIEEDLRRKTELLEIEEVCRNVPARTPRNFREALQYYWFVHLGVITELNPWDAFNPGRLDQHLFPFYRREIEAGTLTREGARYNTNYIQGVGIGTLTDCLSAIQQHVFVREELTLPQLLQILAADFEGHEKTRLLLLNKTPHYGNDDDRADTLMQAVFEAYYQEVNGRPNTKGGFYRIDLLPTTCHVYFGSITGATPDGRKAWTLLSEGISPVQGGDRQGPTAVLKSAAKMDHVRTGGTLLNQKFTPRLLEGEKGIDNLAHLVRTYFKLGGHHIQFNVVDAATPRDAQAHPENHRDLIVRVAGYSDYFCDLGHGTDIP
jgi:pyruvate-formate lyase